MSSLRMPDLNRVIIAGRLTRDAELKHTASQRAYSRVSIANSRKFKAKDGEVREEAVFLEGTLWDKAAEYAAKLTKGRPVLIEGRLRQSEWDDRETGQKRSRIELAIDRLTPLDWTETAEAAAAETPEDDIPF
jgi:single-strand DNA-binding protein